jgi:hypothetical protein
MTLAPPLSVASDKAEYGLSTMREEVALDHRLLPFSCGRSITYLSLTDVRHTGETYQAPKIFILFHR